MATAKERIPGAIFTKPFLQTGKKRKKRKYSMNLDNNEEREFTRDDYDE